MKNQLPSLHLQGLNGLRAIAAMAVVVSHITIGLEAFGLNPFIFGANYEGNPKGLNLAGFGVSMFFSLSGFLITYLLLLEKEKGGIHIRKFYIRRVLRIWPLYYLYLAVALATSFLVGPRLEAGSIFMYTFYAANVPYIIGGTVPYLVHYWSLGVEEQFYLFWPWLVKKVNRHFFIFICALTVLIIGAKLFFRYYLPGGDQSLVYTIINVTRFHCMMIGGIGAVLYYQRHSLFLRLLNHKLTQAFAWAVLIMVGTNRFHFPSVLDNEFVSVVALILIIGQVNVKHRLINLESRMFDFIGKLSYGLYVIHPLVIFGMGRFIGNVEMPWLMKYLFVYGSIIGLTLMLAYLSYEYFEKKFLRLKHQYSVINTSPNIDQELMEDMAVRDAIQQMIKSRKVPTS